VTSVKREVDHWNSNAWSNFVKSYVPAADSGSESDASENGDAGDTTKTNWNANAWSNFVKSYVPSEDKK
jgi:hypothetical protein